MTVLLHEPPKSLNEDKPFSERVRSDCLIYGGDDWRDAGVKLNRLIAYVEQLEARVSELEKRQS